MQINRYERDIRYAAFLARLLLAAAIAAVIFALCCLFYWEGVPLLKLSACACALLFSGAAIGAHINVFRPLIRVQREFRKLAGAEKGEELSDAQIGELAEETGLIGSLIFTVANSVHSGSKAKALNAEVALYALQSEINPHFLYNALEVIRNYAMNHGIQEISDMTLALARIFRYSISRPGEVATLMDEINNVKNYMKIQQYRFPNRFSIAIDIDTADADIMKCTLPVLTLQPIVENALTHGLENLTHTGQITLRAVASDRRLVITITDNGVGITPEKLEELRERLKSGFVPQGKLPGRQLDRKSGVSLNNVNSRLKIYFGNEYGLSVTSCVGRFTSVEIVVSKIFTV